MTKSYEQVCPIARTLDILGDRWTLLIVRDLFFGTRRFTEFLASSPGLPPKLLSDRLKKLERHRLVERVLYSEHPLRAEYRLTSRGRTLRPVVEALARWGADHCFEEEPEAREQVLRKIASRLAAATE